MDTQRLLLGVDLPEDAPFSLDDILAVPLAADDNGGGGAQVCIVKGDTSPGGGSEHPQALFLQDILEKATAAGEPPLVVVCDEISDPHNLGAIIRTAECAGAHGVIIFRDTVLVVSHDGSFSWRRPRKRGGNLRRAYTKLVIQISDPHNLGAIIRTAECAGAHGVIIPKRRSAGLTAVVGEIRK